MRGETVREVKRLILTASGGPFRQTPIERMHEATVEEALAHPTWQELFSRLIESTKETHLDTAQLIRHYLGLRNYVLEEASGRPRSATLLYIYWLPRNWDSCGSSDFVTHRAEVETFGNDLGDSRVGFAAFPYS